MNNDMDTTITVTAEQLSNTEFLLSHLLFFEDLLKEAAALMTKVQKYQRAANNIKSPTWEKASIPIEESSQRIRAVCTYTGVPASHLPSNKLIVKKN
ncbi:hypothetical protein CDAR_53041 [Caerostris darwini]|uniref:Uncharacterized protein n=1 Tax=Caerostris darwini TaxID=1538125 RepID=A0AAV4QU81_9ARAC|nr:hypothetical protein CDAR_53041 [Caerostris darwini]